MGFNVPLCLARPNVSDTLGDDSLVRLVHTSCVDQHVLARRSDLLARICNGDFGQNFLRG